MGKYVKMILVGTLMGLLLVSAVGCGQKQAAQPKAEEKQPPPAPPVKKTVSFAMSGGYPPFNYFDKENKLVGFDVDTGKEIAKRIGKEYEPVTTAWDGIIEGLRAGRYDGILGSMAITEERLKVVDFSDPYYYSGAQLIVKGDSKINSAADLKDAVIGVGTGETYEKDARALKGVKDVRLYEDSNQTMRELNAGRIDGVITDRIVGLNAIKELGYNLRLAGSVLRSEKMGVAFRQDDDQLRESVNKAMKAMREDGTLKAISIKWLGADITNE